MSTFLFSSFFVKLMCVVFTNEWQVDFILTGKLGVTTGGAQKLEYNHKLCYYKFWQHRNKGNKIWHTGTWNKKLQTLANGTSKASSGNIEVQASARYILNNIEINTRSIAPPVKGVSFEGDIIHHIHEEIVIHYHSMRICILGPG